jgi:transposase-like protein
MPSYNILVAVMLHLNLTRLLDDSKCYETVRQLRWVAGVCCPKCRSLQVIKRGKDDTQPARQRYQCKGCGAQFDDLTDTIFAGHHQPLRVWILCLYLMGLNLSNRQIAQELDLDEGDVHAMTAQLRQGIVDGKPEVYRSGEVECNEVYVTAGHKGNPEAVRKKGAPDDAIGSKGFGVAAHLKKRNRPFSA